MARYTRKDAEAAFQRLCQMLGKRVATKWNDVGAWQLDHNSAYGGFVVHEITTESGGVSLVLGYERRSAREFCDAVHFLAEALRGRKVL